MAALSFVADGQVAVSEEPGDRSLDLPAVSSKAFGGLLARPGDPWSMWRSRSHARLPAEWYALSARTFSGRRRRGPRRERTAGIPRMSGRSAWTSLTFAADTPMATGSSCASVRTCRCPLCLDRPDSALSTDPPFRAHRDGIGDHGTPVESATGSGLVQDYAVQSTPHSGGGPDGEPPVSRRR